MGEKPQSAYDYRKTRICQKLKGDIDRMKLSNKILAFVLAVSLTLNLGMIVTNSDLCRKKDSMASKVSNIYDSSLSTLSRHCTELENNFSKLSVCTGTEEASKVLSDIVSDSGSALTALDMLPMFPEYVASLNRYLNHVSDYSRYLLSVCSSGSLPSDDCMENINAMHTSVIKMNTMLNEFAEKLKSKPLDWQVLMNSELDEYDFLSTELSDTFESIQTESISYPTLIYDGPFSDTVVNKVINEPEGKALTKNEAAAVFKEFIGSDKSFSVYNVSRCEGIIDTWCVTLERNGKYYYGSVAEKTGSVVSYITDGYGEKNVFSKEELVKKASDFLIRSEYNDMQPQYCQITGGSAVINYVRSEEGVLIYPDMVKVRVNTETGEITGFEGMSYYANHTKERNLAVSPAHSAEECLSLLPEGCEPYADYISLIPTDGENEILAYEFRCRINGEEFVLYYDVEKLKQVKIFKIISSENGDYVV